MVPEYYKKYCILRGREHGATDQGRREKFLDERDVHLYLFVDENAFHVRVLL